MLRFLFSICMVGLLAAPLAAQQLSFNTYTPADGLIDARVQKIFQDSRGMLYFLTRDGFCSFDGQRFQHYTQYNNQPLSIVNDIVEEEPGLLLVSAISGLYRLQHNRLEKDTLLSARLREPGAIIASGDHEWIILSNAGSFVYHGKKIQPLSITENNQPATALLLDRAVCTNAAIIGTRTAPGNSHTQLVWYNRAAGSLRILIESDTPMEISRFGTDVYVKNAGNWKLLNSALLPQEKNILLPLPFASGAAPLHFYIDGEQNKWLFNPDQTVTYMHSSGERITYTADNGLPYPISNMFRDRENNYWFMVEGKGVYKLIQSGIQQYRLPGLSGQVQSISSTGNNSICLRNNNLLFLLNGPQLVQKNIVPKPGLIQAFQLHTKWYAVYNNGLLENEEGKSIRFASFAAGSKQVSSRISIDKKGRILTGGDFLSVIENDSLLASIPLPYFTDIVVADEQNNYWCFARNGTILAYSLSGYQLKQAAAFTDNSYSTRFAIHWNNDSFYIGTRNNGLILVKASPSGYKKMGTISTADGLSNNFITGLLKIDNERLLTASVTGLDMVHFSAAGVSAEQLFSRTGLFTGVPALLRSNDSTVLVLTDGGGLYQLGVKQSANTGISPSLFFSSITVNGALVDPGRDITFTYNRNNFRIAVSAPGFIDEKNIRFIFSLNGQKIITGPATRSGETEFTNLAPGRYTITVTALFPGNDTTRQSITYSFRIRKPFWKTYGFIAALTLLILLLIYSIFRVQLRRKLQLQQIELEKEKAIARERSRIASDMHDDLGAGISTIKYLSQSAPFIGPDIQKENNLKIAAQADELVDKMNDIIWAMNEKNDTLDNLVFYTKAWIANFAQQHDIAATITIPSVIPSTIIRGEKRQHIFLCIKEAVHNIIKHAGANELWLSLTLNDQQLQVSIQDNGCGFDTKKMVSGNGLANMQKRIKAVKGQISIESGNGTTIRFSVPV